MTIIILAAGMGSRYGGPKQLEPLGPGGATMPDYALHDALRAGFSHAVLVVRQEMADAFEATAVARWRPHLPVTLVFQDLHDLPPGFGVPPGRTKPWGTGQAVLAAAGAVHGAFAVVNADDFYGAEAYATLAAFLRAQEAAAEDVPAYANVGFALRDTLTGGGSVNRAVLQTTPEGWLLGIEEVLGIEQAGGDGQVREANGVVRHLPGATQVSMNMWGFTPAVFDQLAAGFRDFLAHQGGALKSEFLLPEYVQQLVRRGAARVRVLPGAGRWCGITHPEDRPHVVARLRGLVAEGTYPEVLWA
jgi:NDP-sugar pyrophosphorylase family protein